MFSRALCRASRTALPRARANATGFRAEISRSAPIRSSPQWIPRRQKSTVAAARELWRENPVAFPLALMGIFAGAGFLLYSTYVYTAYVGPINTAFPPPVANQLRRAIYYSNVDLQPAKALRHYQQALRLAAEHGMPPFGDEVLGVKLTLAALLERIGQVDKAVEVLELVREDCLGFVKEVEKRVKEGNYTETKVEKKVVDGEEVEVVLEESDLRKDRTRVLAKAVAICVKLGELYSGDHMQDMGQAERNFVQGVELCLKEENRRKSEGVKEEDEGSWVSNEEVGGTLEALAYHYESKSQHNLSAPLFLRALTLDPPPCHKAILMNNLAISLAQTSPESLAPPPSSSSSSSSSSTTPPTSRPALISNARTWAEKALEVARATQPPQRTDECDMACAVATHNLGELAEMEGRRAEAARRYAEARSLAGAIKFQDGVDQANEALERLKKEGGA